MRLRRGGRLPLTAENVVAAADRLDAMLASGRLGGRARTVTERERYLMHNYPSLAPTLARLRQVPVPKAGLGPSSRSC